MKIGVLTITWNRLWYTYHCLKRLKEKAGYPYEHIIVDNGSQDGTYEFLKEESYNVIRNKENFGIVKAFYQGVEYLEEKNVEYIIKIDNDCEIETDNIFKKTVEFLQANPGYIVSPRINGLNSPPKTTSEEKIGDLTFQNTGNIGGIFCPHPVKDLIVKSINNGTYLDDNVINPFYRGLGYKIGYIKEWEANHFETTNGQKSRYGEKVGYKF